MKQWFSRIYQRLVFDNPTFVLIFTMVIGLLLTQFISDFRLDASSDSIVLENDESLRYYQKVVSQYGNSDYLVLSYAPKGDLFSDEVLNDLSQLRERLLNLTDVQSVMSIIDVPLMQSPPQTLIDLNSAPIFLQSEQADRTLAKKELRSNPLYRDLLVSDDLSTTALIVQLAPDDELKSLYDKRNHLRQQSQEQRFNETENKQLEQVALDYQNRLIAFQQNQATLIASIRKIIAMHADKASMFLGGVPMITTDSIEFIHNDLVVFGSLALLVIIAILMIAFRQAVWVIVPLVICAITGYLMMCLLGLLNWPVSVVSSNFLSLLLIITLSLNIHLIVRYRELSNADPDKSNKQRLIETIESKFVPCLYTAITTIIAFASLLVSGIRPVIDFGWMMCVGIVVAVLTTFILFPVLISLFKPSHKNLDSADEVTILNFFARSVNANAVLVVGAFIAILGVSIYGIGQLTVENRFIDYFKPSTEIYQGMHTIDEKLGGTTPLDIIIDAPHTLSENDELTNEAEGGSINGAIKNLADGSTDNFFDDSVDDFDYFSDEVPEPTLKIPGYWLKASNIARIEKIHKALEAMPETGKVMSLATPIGAFNQLKDAKPLDDIDLATMYQVLSDDNKQLLIAPYMSESGEQIRINLRIFETNKGLQRNQFINDIQQMLIKDFNLDESQVHLSGMLVLYNNMLNSLFKSQIMTLSMVFLMIFIVFILLFKNLKMALVGIAPNIFAATLVLGLMGLFAISLDLMTITIAAICVGIGVDNTIHYVHRFTDEFNSRQDYSQALSKSATSIGKAMYYTSVVITVGFMILIFSNFVPTVYFGLLTGVAMVSALIANLVLLPVLIKKVKPL